MKLTHKHSLVMRIAFLVVILFISSRVFAQDTARMDWNKHVKVALNMEEKQYSQYIAAKEKYNKQLSKIVRDPALDISSKIVEVDKVLIEKRAVIKQILTEDQIKNLAELEKQRAMAKDSPYYKHQQEQEARMKQRIQERTHTDSVRLKSAGQ